MESKSKSVAETLAEDAILAEQGIISESDFREFLLKDEGRKLKIKYYLQGFRACVEQAERWCGLAHPRSLSGIEYLNGEQCDADQLHKYLEKLLGAK